MSNKISTNFIFFIFFCLAWLDPNKTSPWRVFDSDFIIFFAFLIVGFFSLKKIKISYHHLLIILVAFIPILQIFFDINIFYGDAIIAFIYLTGFFYCFTLGFNLKKDFIFEVIVYSILFSCFVSVFIALSQWLTIDWGLWFLNEAKNRAFANFGQPNQLATFLCWGIIASSWLLWKKKISIITYAFMIALFAIGIATTYSRAAHITVLGICLLLLYYRKTSTYQFYLPLLVFIIYASSQISIFNLSELLNTYSRDIENSSNIGPRKIHWLTALDAIKNAPFFGYGWNQVSVALANSVVHHEASHEFIEHSHNLILDLFIWNGIPVGIAIILFLAIFIKRNIQQTFINQKIAMLMVLSLIPHAMLEFPLEYAYILLPAAFLMGYSDNSQPALKILPPIYLSFFAIYAIVMSAILVEYKNIEERYQILRFQSAGIITPTPEKNKIIFFNQHEKFLEFAATEAYPGMPKEKIAMMDAVALRFGYPPVLFRHALASALNGNQKKAQHSLLRICKTAHKDICAEAQESWRTAQTKYKELEGINFPK